MAFSQLAHWYSVLMGRLYVFIPVLVNTKSGHKNCDTIHVDFPPTCEPALYIPDVCLINKLSQFC